MKKFINIFVLLPCVCMLFLTEITHSFAQNEDKKITKGIIVAAGKGTRMRPYSYAVSKELILLGDKPIIHHIVEEFTASGITEILIIISSAKSSIVDYFNNIKKDKYNINYIVQPEPKGPGEALLIAKSWVEGESFVFALGDSLISTKEEAISYQPLLKLLNSYHIKDADFYVLGTLKDDYKKKGIIQLNGQIASKNSPQKKYIKAAARWILTPRVFSFIESYQKNQTTKEIDFVEVIKSALSKNKATGFVEIISEDANDLGTWPEFLQFSKKYLGQTF